MARYDVGFRQATVELIEGGYGWRTVARRLEIPADTAREWIHTYRACGREAFLSMGSRHRSYDYETKLAAVLDHVEGGMTKQEVMQRHGIASETALKGWVKRYREGGPEALRPRPKGRPRGARRRPEPTPTREQELEAENRRLRAEVAYLKKLRALGAMARARGTGAR